MMIFIRIQPTYFRANFSAKIQVKYQAKNRVKYRTKHQAKHQAEYQTKTLCLMNLRGPSTTCTCRRQFLLFLYVSTNPTIVLCTFGHSQQPIVWRRLPQCLRSCHIQVSFADLCIHLQRLCKMVRSLSWRQAG